MREPKSPSLFSHLFIYFSSQVNINPPEWEGYTETVDEGDNMQLTDFENLILIKSFREEKVCVVVDALYFGTL